jgi:hypothetical protein
MAGRHDGGAGVPRGRALSHIYSGGTGTEPTFGGCRCRVRWVTPNDGGVTRVASSLQISIEAPNLLVNLIWMSSDTAPGATRRSMRPHPRLLRRPRRARVPRLWHVPALRRRDPPRHDLVPLARTGCQRHPRTVLYVLYKESLTKYTAGPRQNDFSVRGQVPPRAGRGVLRRRQPRAAPSFPCRPLCVMWRLPRLMKPSGPHEADARRPARPGGDGKTAKAGPNWDWCLPGAARRADYNTSSLLGAAEALAGLGRHCHFG